MAKRKFSGRRLYGLLKRFVIIVSVTSAILSAILFRQVYSNAILNMYKDVCADFSKEPSDLYVSDYSWCMAQGFGVIDQTTKEAFITLGIAIFLPIFFFGGTWIYQYLFPEVKKENEK